MKEKKNISLICLGLSYVILLLAHFYYPKWKNERTEATISWDVSGYYMYLPAFFIYKDIKKCAFLPDIVQKYQPTPSPSQAYKHESGNYIMSYSMGQAIQFLPAFTVAHIWASFSSKYDADGFSFPYQFMVSLFSLLLAFIGLYFLRKILLRYFDDWIAGITLLLLLLGTNYLNYAAIDSVMTHNHLFTIYTLIIYTTILFYEKANMLKAIVLGALIGLAALTRPTEVITCLIPLFWGLNFLEKGAIAQRLLFFKKHLPKLIIAAVVCLSIGSLQLIYWKYVSGSWVVYSYRDQGFSWLRPHIKAGMISPNNGWLMYSPLMIFSLIGFIPLYFQQKKIFFTVCLYACLVIYITFAWDIWWYGGSLGQRAMIQSYPIFMIALAAFLVWLSKRKILLKLFFGSFIIVFCYLSLWFLHQAHKGGMYLTEQMTKAYYWKVLGTFEKKEENFKLLDTNELFEGKRKGVQTLYKNDFEDWVFEKTNCAGLWPDTLDKGFCLSKDVQKSPMFFSQNIPQGYEWLRVSVDCRVQAKEWNIWRSAQILVRFLDQSNIVKQRQIRLYRFLNDGDSKQLYIDVKIPKRKQFDKVDFLFDNMKSDKVMKIDNLTLEVFNEE